MSRTRVVLAVAAVLIVSALVLVVGRESQLLAQSREALRAGRFAEASQIASQVQIPPLSSQAAQIRAQADAAAAAQMQARQEHDRLESALAASASATADIATADSLLAAETSEAEAAGQKRHDDAISGSVNVAFESREAVIEQSTVSKLTAAVGQLVSGYHAEIDAFTPFFGSSDLSRLQEAVETLSAEYATHVSAWSTAIREIADAFAEC